MTWAKSRRPYEFGVKASIALKHRQAVEPVSGQVAQVLTRADVFFEQGQKRSNGRILVRCFIGTGDDDL